MTLQRDYDHYMLIHFLFYFLSALKGDLATYHTHYSHIYPRGLLDESFKMIFFKKKKKLVHNSIYTLTLTQMF
jgi:hypothetical protein